MPFFSSMSRKIKGVKESLCRNDYVRHKDIGTFDINFNTDVPQPMFFYNPNVSYFEIKVRFKWRFGFEIKWM